MSSRRRLRIITSSDEEDDDDEIQEVQPPPQQHDDIECETLNLQDVTLSSINSNTTNRSASNHVEISDEDFIEAAENLFPSPPNPPPPASVPPPPPSNQTSSSSEFSRTSSVSTGGTSDSPISRILEDLGLRLRGEWLDACLHGLQTAIPGFSTFDSTKKAKLCFEKFLNSDMNISGAGLLPDNVHQMHLVDLPGPFVLQVDEIVNISQPLRDRYKKASSGLKRCLKLSITDGVQRVFGMEYQPIKDLEALAHAGLKVAISNVNVRHGLLMLVPEVFQVLGGVVEELDAARQRLVEEVNKPPRGKRTRSGVVPPLATRATLAAWPADNVPVSGASNDNTAPQSATPLHVNNQGITPPSVNGRVPSSSSVPVHRENVSGPSNNRALQNATPMHVDDQGTTTSFNRRVSSNSSVPVHRENVSNNRAFQNAPPIHVDDQGITPPSVNGNGRVSSNSSIPVHRESVTSNPVFQNATPIQADVQGTTPHVNGRVPSMSSVPAHREHVSVPTNNSVFQNATPILVDDQGTSTTPPVNGGVASNSSVPIHRENVSRPSNNPFSQNTTPMQVDDQGTAPSVNGNGRVPSNSSIPAHRENVSTNRVSQNATPIYIDDQATTPPCVSGNGRVSSNSMGVEVEPCSTSRPNAQPFQFTAQRSTNPNAHHASHNATPIHVDNHNQGTTHTTQPFQFTAQQRSPNTHITNPPVTLPTNMSHLQPLPDDVDDVHMAADVDNHSFYGRNTTESPFTYMASLSVKWAGSKHTASHVQGKIKCFMTGVKGFQYKKRRTFELQVYVDDGSLISEILIDHNVVQRKIGYSPEEVNTALLSSDPSRVQDMKDKMKQFQVFLVNFEGTMAVRINEACALPVAIEMEQGCTASDAWSLLTRLKSSNTTHQPPQRPQLIELSP